MNLRDYQQEAVDLALESLAPGSRLMIGSPTGTGKSFMALAIQEAVPGSVILTPSNEIIRGFKDKDGSCEVYTPVKYRNMLMDGHPLPSMFIVDEGHQSTDSTSLVTADLFAIAPEVPAVALTATVFRGTPKGTQALRETWGDPQIVLTITDAVERGYWQMPDLAIVPLLDDDQLTVSNGQFVISSVDDGTKSRLESLIECIRTHRDGPTIVTLPSTESVRAVEMVMGDEVCSITQSTPDRDRVQAYEDCKSGDKVLLQILALTTGVDIPELQTLIDARPTLSPVNFLQLFGRLTRPYPVTKKYVCTNRNLERHAYLLESLVPLSRIGESQKAFDGPSVRMATKTLGLEATSRFKVIPVELENGVTAGMYALQTLTPERKLKEYLLLCLPNFMRPLIFSRLSGKAVWDEETALPSRAWGKWKIERDLPDDFCGYKTSPSRGKLSDKQIAWWKRAAAHRGLNPDAADEMERRQFPILPALLDSRLSLKPLLGDQTTEEEK